ncbi:MCP four helix bundle domain-containing protein [Porifericola rhodea]|uniref:MCP four helix bundle domain-containing protein n=1 Tax=Porifericola rhodea TaxID=930972 RepID=UPI002664E3DA|nr:MCP four helix bundle domain-containing protein [Porifericola rhodea]WKN31290.1 MCP four helix bundle domain-containing protein [Porifericola rhodea]
MFGKLTNRERIIISFLVILVLINVMTIVTSRNLSDFSHDFKSMLEDRLVPSFDLAKIQEQFYRNRLNLEELVYLNEYEEARTVIEKIRENNRQIDAIEAKYAQTHLTEDEEQRLTEFNMLVKNYRRVEEKIIHHIENNNFEEASSAYLRESLPAFEKLLDTTQALEDIQITVGEKLYKHAQKKVGNIQVLAYLSLGIAIMITVNMLKVLQIKVK